MARDGGYGADMPVAVVVGGDTGLGAAVVAQLAACGAIVVATAPDARRIPGRLSRAGQVERARLDPASASPEMLRGFFTELANAYHRCDALIYIGTPVRDGGRFASDTAEHLGNLLAANLIGPWNLAATAAGWMTDLGGGRVVLTVTDCSRIQGGAAPGWQVSQAALTRYAELLAAECRVLDGNFDDEDDEEQGVKVSTLVLEPDVEQWEPARLATLAGQIVSLAVPQAVGG